MLQKLALHVLMCSLSSMLSDGSLLNLGCCVMIRLPGWSNVCPLVSHLDSMLPGVIVSTFTCCVCFEPNLGFLFGNKTVGRQTCNVTSWHVQWQWHAIFINLPGVDPSPWRLCLYHGCLLCEGYPGTLPCIAAECSRAPMTRNWQQKLCSADMTWAWLTQDQHLQVPISFCSGRICIVKASTVLHVCTCPMSRKEIHNIKFACYCT
jgi:hypothetical protein